MKQSVCSLISILAVLLLFPPLLSAQQTTYEISSGEYEIVENSQGLHEIRMLDPAYSLIGSAGDPALPHRIFEFQLPADVDPSNVELNFEVVQSEVLPGITMIPVPPLGPVQDTSPGEYDPDALDWGTEKSIVEGRNTFVYNQDANYPEEPAELLMVSQRKVPLAPGPLLQQFPGLPGDSFQNASFVVFSYRPFLYNPVQGELTHVKSMIVTISYDSSSPVLYGEDSLYEPMSNGSYDYVIITTEDILSNSDRLDDFVYLKELYGHNVLIVTESQYGSLAGQAPNGTAEKIRQWLKNNYLALGINYVLLVGDPNPDDPNNPGDTVGDVPMKMCWPRYTAHEYRESPTDYFYADLTGNWDLDGDQYFGETLDFTNERSPHPSIGENTFSVLWTGKLQCDYNENYEFHTFSDDGVRLYVDGSPIINNWTEHLPANDYATQAMTAGKHNITVEFRENTGDGIIQLFWRTTVTKGHAHYVPDQIIPETHLYDNSDSVGGLTGTYYNNSDFTGTSLTRKDKVINFVWAQGDRGTGGPDSGAEVFVGRIPVYNDNYDHLDGILGKIIEYETDPGDISWRESILLPMKPLWDDTPSYHLGEGIRNDYASAAGFATYRIYDDDYAPPTPELWPCTKNNVMNEWVNGYGIVTWTTHGSSEGAGDIFDSSLTGNLDDSMPAFTFQASCLNGYPENSNNLGYALLREGAIATVSASRVSWDSHGAWTFSATSAKNHNFAYFYTKKIMNDGIPKPAGVALYLTKGAVPDVGMNSTDYNLYGDPDCYLLKTVADSPPVADANGPYTADEGTAVSFDASASSDPEGASLKYRWDFDNNGTWDTAWSANPMASYTWCDDFSGLAKLEVRDPLGLTDETTTPVTINNVAPTISLDSLDQPNPQFILPVVHNLHYNGSFTDPGCLDTHISSWDFGDSTVVTGTVIEENEEPDATGTTTADHTYMTPGSYTVTVEVTDDDGGKGTDTMELVVVDEVGAKHDINDYIQSLPSIVFKNNADKRKNAIANMIAALDYMFDTEAYEGAIQYLLSNLRSKMDGQVDGKPGDDWIIDDAVQAELCMKIDDLVAYLEYLKGL
ncbi:MAG: C25 family cysteine peptidase [Pseudomonadota bacterium]|nr:C25 family cysteine peptidase [Pseudomonadota bacterium]